MDKKRWISLGVGGVLLLLLISSAFLAFGLSSEGSKVDAMLKDANTKHMPQAELIPKLQEMGFELVNTPTHSDGKGPVHSIIIYSARLSVTLEFDAEGKNTAYHLDKA